MDQQEVGGFATTTVIYGKSLRLAPLLVRDDVAGTRPSVCVRVAGWSHLSAL